MSSAYRHRVKQELDLIQPFDGSERADLVWATHWVMSAEEICRIEKPATPPTHLVSYCLLVDGDYLLLVDHINAELWLPTGGHVDPGEHPRKAAFREAVEELGYRHPADIAAPVFLSLSDTVGKTRGHRDVSIWYVLPASRSVRFVFDHSEFSSVRWFHRDELIASRSDPNLPRFVEKLKSGTA